MADDDDDDFSLSVKPAFAIAGRSDPDFSQPAAHDAMEYLRRVRYEAGLLPPHKTVAIEPTRNATPLHARRDDRIGPTAGALMPKAEWIRAFIADATAHRNRLSRTSASADDMSASTLQRYIRNAVGADYDGTDYTAAPFITHISRMSARNNRSALDALIQELSRRYQRALTAQATASSSCCDAAWLSLPGEHHSEWLYVMLIRLDTPLLPDTQAQLRQVYRICGNIRSHISNILYAETSSSHQHQHNNNTLHETGKNVTDNAAHICCDDCLLTGQYRVMLCNMIMSIVHQIFGQSVQ